VFIGADRKLDVFTKYYDRLAKVVLSTELSPKFVSARIITNRENQTIQNTAESASFILDRIKCSLEGSLSGKFEVVHLEDDNDLSCVELANQMRQEL